MRLSPLLTLFCLAGLSVASAFSQSGTLARRPDSTPSAPFAHVPTLNLKPAISIVLPPNLTLNRNATCYVIDSRQFPQSGSNFDPAVSTTRSVCQPASQFHLKAATASPAK